MSRTMTRKAKLYSPNQVALLSWLAPPAGVFALAKNFHVLGNKTASMMTLLCGGLFVVWYYGVMFFSEEPREVPLFALTYLAFINAAHQVAIRRQLSSFAISQSKVFDVQSEEIVAGVIAATLTGVVVFFTAVEFVSIFGFPGID
jgi:hypothetical protein